MTETTELTEQVEVPVPDVKPGYKTTEFYLTLTSYFLAALVVVGAVSAQDAQHFLDQLGQFATALLALITAAGPIVTTVAYTVGRARVKAGK